MDRRDFRPRHNAPLMKPKFSKIEQIQPAHHCYNVFVKIVEVTHSQLTKNDGEVLSVAEGVCGDETGVARFKIIGEAADMLTKDKVVAFRNGISNVVGGNVRLEINKFGRVTEENSVQIDKVDQSNDISAIEYERVSQSKLRADRDSG